jgi:hypothetical protein
MFLEATGSVGNGKEALATAAVVTTGLTGCSGGSSGASSASSATSSTNAAASTSSAATGDSAAAGTSAAASSDLGQVVEITVAGGKVIGPKGRVMVKKGSTVTLKVTSDVADEVHLHGYDKHVDVEKGGTATLTFTASLAGVFEAELESRSLQLVQLQVQ